MNGKARQTEIIQLSPTKIQLRNGLVQRTLFLSLRALPALTSLVSLMTEGRTAPPNGHP